MNLDRKRVFAREIYPYPVCFHVAVPVGGVIKMKFHDHVRHIQRLFFRYQLDLDGGIVEELGNLQQALATHAFQVLSW